VDDGGVGMTKVTCIISAYYAKRFIDGRMINIMRQELQPEIVGVCKKGSYEHDCLKSYGARIITTPDIPTIYWAWNKAIEHATGEYITNANCDDTYYEGFLHAMSKALDENPNYGVVYSDVCRSTAGATRVWIRIGAGTTNEYEELKRRCFIGPMPMWRRELHIRHGLFRDDYKVAGDWDFWLRIAKNGERFFYIPRSLGCYNHRTNSLERREKHAHHCERIEIRKRHSRKA
jgi:glycosyltransferase involved in cell wall biosynthesis